jgi:epoxyqueuosine reductase QueG
VLEKEIKKIALENHLDYVGITPVERLAKLPEGHKPADILPQARSIISLGIKISEGVIIANQRAYQGLRHAIYTYLWHGYGLLNLHFLDKTALKIVNRLEKEGFIGYPIGARTVEDLSKPYDFFHRNVAIAAGLGEMGFHSQLLTPDDGPRIRLASVLTSAELEPDPMYEGPRLCDPRECRNKGGQGIPICQDICPSKAIGSEERIEIEIGGKRFKSAELDQFKCMWGNWGLHEDALAIRPIPMPERVTFQEVFEALKQRDPIQVVELMVPGRGNYCDRCIVECPVGRAG